MWFHAGYVSPVFDWPWGRAEVDRVGAAWGRSAVAAAQSGNGKSPVDREPRGPPREAGHLRLTVAPLERKRASSGPSGPASSSASSPGPPSRALGPATEGSQGQVLAHMTRRRSRRCARGSPCPGVELNRGGLERLVARAHSGAPARHRGSPASHGIMGRAESRGIRDTMKLAKRLAQGLDLPSCSAAQLNRGHERG